MKNYLFFTIFICCGLMVFPQQTSDNTGQSDHQKFALVIGNGNYNGIAKLTNPVNDANDMAAVLTGLGFTVDKILDGNLEQMENAVELFKNRLSVSKNSYGFLFYAEHGVQSNGELGDGTNTERLSPVRINQ